MAQLELAPILSEDLFNRFHLTNPPLVYIDGNIDTYKLFEIEQLLNKYVVKCNWN